MTKVVGFLVAVVAFCASLAPLQATQTPAELAGIQIGSTFNIPFPPTLGGIAALDVLQTNGITADAQGGVQMWNAHGALPAHLLAPEGLTNVVDVAIGESFAAAVTADGAVVCWGDLEIPPELQQALTNITRVAAGNGHILALAENGKVFAWGNDEFGQATVPASLSNVIAIVAGPAHSLALQENGHVVGWGDNSSGQLNCPEFETSNAAIATGTHHTLLLRKNGTVAAFGDDLGNVLSVPVGLNGVTAVAAMKSLSLALTSAGSIVRWGIGSPRPYPQNVDALFARDSLAIAWVKHPVFGTVPSDVLAATGEDIELTAPVYGKSPLHYQWKRGGVEIPGATQPTLNLTDVGPEDEGVYSLVVTNAFGQAESSGITFRTGVPAILSNPQDVMATAGSTVTLEVDAVGFEPLIYTWLVNGTTITDEAGPTLVLSDAQFDDSGDYQVVVSNALGAVTSAVARVQITTIDQQQQSSDLWAALQHGMARASIAQTFTPAVSGRLVKLSLAGAYSEAEPQRPTSISIVNTVNGAPGTTVLGRAVIAQLVEAESIVFDGPPIYLVAGTQYAIVLATDAPVYDASSYHFLCAETDPYPGGRLWRKVGDEPWLDDSPAGYDLVFTTYMVFGLPAVWLPQPIDGTVVRLGESLPISALVSPDVPAPFSMNVYAGDTLLGASTNSPLELNWTPLVAGNVDLVATITDSGGVNFTSGPVRVTIVDSAPENDRFVDRIALDGEYEIVAASNLDATQEPGESPIPLGSDATVWWEWTAPRSSGVTVGVELPDQTNAVLAIYTGSAVDALVPITNRTGYCTFAADEGVTYQIALDSIEGAITDAVLVIALNDVEISNPSAGSFFHAQASIPVQAYRVGSQREVVSIEALASGLAVGNLSLEGLDGVATISQPGYYALQTASTDIRGWTTLSEPVAITVRPANDDFEAAETITGRDVAIHASNVAATMQVSGGGTPWNPQPKIGEPSWADNNGGHSIWYRWTAPANGFCVINGAGANFSLLFNVCLGNSVNTLTVVAANALGYPNTPTVFDAVEGVTYFISVDGRTGEEGLLDWTLQLKPYNDDFARRRLLTGITSEFHESNAGATLEANESVLAPDGTGSSLWYAWEAPLSGNAEIRVTGTNALALAVFRGNSIETLIPVAVYDGDWTANPSLNFQAEAGVQYYFAVFGQGASQGHFLFQFALEGLHLVSPLPNSIFPFPSSITLEAQLGVPGSSLKEVVYYVNGVEIGRTTNTPSKINWVPPAPATYTFTAEGLTTDGTTYNSRPITCLLYSGKQMPRPRVFSGVSSATSYVINSVGALYLFGGQPNQFGRTTAQLLSTPFLAVWPAGVTGWREVSGAFALSDAGELYQNGEVLIPFPPGITEWKRLSSGFSGVVTIGDDGHIYWGGTDRIEVQQPPGGWRDLGASLAGPNNSVLALGEDGEAYRLSYLVDQWSVSLLTRPAEVTRWESIANAAFFGVLLTDQGELYIYGMNGGVTGPEGTSGWSYVPRPSGVNRWVDFAAGGYHVLAIGDNAQLYAWGRNWEHQLGLGQDVNPRSTPELVTPPAGVTGWSAVAAGEFHSIAIGHDCSVYAWGQNNLGQVGQAASAPLARPFRVSSLEALCGTPVLFTDGNSSRLPDGSFKLEFNSDLNRGYLIQYTDDLLTWKNAGSTVVGTGALVEWIDDGPPKTDRHPAEVSQRSYRVVYAP